MSNIITGAGVLLHNGRKVLLVYQRASKMWSIPKGCKEKGECNQTCWRRELAEEAGIRKIPIHRITGMYDILDYNITIAELFTDHLPFPFPNDNEIVEAKWIELKDAVNMNVNALTRKILKLYIPSDPFTSFRRKLPSKRKTLKCSSRSSSVNNSQNLSWRSSIDL